MFLSVNMIRDRCGVSKALIYSWIESGALPHYRFGRKGRRGKIMVQEDELEGFLAGMRGQAAPNNPAPGEMRTVKLENLKLNLS